MLLFQQAVHVWNRQLTCHSHSRQVSCFSVDLQSVEGMKVLCFELMEAAAGRASAYMLANLAASANELVIELTNRVHRVNAHTITGGFA